MELTKEVVYDRATRDYAMKLDGRLVGYRSTQGQAAVALDGMVYAMLTHGLTVDEVSEVTEPAVALAA